MSKIYKNHVFRRTTLPWQWLAAISFAIAMLASIGAYVSARSWVAEGRYLQSLDIAQIEVLRLVPALKDLQKQTTGTSALDSEFFANLKKTDRLLKSMTDDIKKPADAAASTANTGVTGTTGISKPPPVKSLSASGSKLQAARGSNNEPAPELAVLSENSLVAFFQKLDSKIMKIVFGKPDKYADSNKDDEAVAPEQKPARAADVQEVLLGAKNVELAISLVLTQEKPLGGLMILAKSAQSLLDSKGALELDKLSMDSPARKYAESLTEFVKANSTWQKNITSPEASAELQKALGAVIDQKVLLEIEAGKKTAGKSTLSLTQAMPKVHQSPWHTQLPQESALALKIYSANMQSVRDFVTDPEALQVITQKNSPSLDLLDFKTAGGFLGLTLLSMIGMIGAGIGGLMSVYNATQNVADAQRSSKVASAADQLLGSIDLGLAKAPGKQPPKFVEELKPSVEKPAPEAKASPVPESKTTAVMAELSQALKDKVSDIDVRLKTLGQIASKLRHSVKTLQDKSAQMRSDSTEQSDETYHASSSAGRSSPLDQLQDAFFALKQQGVRLYLAILDNHSSKQLAIETEQLNLLVERVETTVSKMRSTLASTFDQVSEAQSTTPQVSPEIVELINMDANQVMRDLELWQDEFEGLGKAVVGLKQEMNA